MVRYIKLTITDEAATWLENYRQSMGLKSTTAAIMQLSEKSMKDIDPGAPKMSTEWGGERRNSSLPRSE